MVQFEVLGPMRVGGEAQTTRLEGRLRQGLLAVLLSRANTPVPAEELLESLWGPEPDASLGRLQTTVHKLRKALGEPDRVIFGPGGYLIQVHAGELDAQRFDHLLGEAADAADPRRRASLLRESLSLWRGEPYQGIDVAALVSETQRLTERRLTALEDLYAAELEAGEDGAIVPELSDVVRRHPLRERLQGLLMTALYRSGRRADALATYRRAQRTLAEELGLEPGHQLRELERLVLAGEPDPRQPVVGHTPRPAQLPHDPPGFVGRQDLLAELDRPDADGPARLTTVTGTAGVGKTALVTHWAHRVRDRFEDGQLFVDLHGHGPDAPLPPADVLVAFLQAMGADEARIPRDEAQRAALFRTMTDGKRMLLVLDNAADESQVRPLLPGSRTCCVVITSRDSLSGLIARDGAHRVEVDPLTHDEAHRLLVGRLGQREPDDGAVGELIERCARLPLALLVAAERVAGQPSRPVSDLVAQLRGAAGGLDVLDGGDERTSVRAVLSWSYRRLTSDAARLFRRTGFHCMHPGHHMDVHAACAALDTDDVAAAGRALAALERSHLVESAGAGRYRMHNLLHAYARELGESEEDGEATIARLLGYMLSTTIEAMRSLEPREVEPRAEIVVPAVAPTLCEPEVARRWLEAHLASVLCLSEYTAAQGWHGLAIDVSTTLWRHLDLHGHLDAARQVHARARAAARHLGDRVAEGVAVRGLGLVELRRGNLGAAERHLLESCELHDGPAHRLLRATTTGHLVAVHVRAGADDAVLRTLQQARELHAAAVSSRWQAVALIDLAEVSADAGEIATAIDVLRQAAEVADRTGAPELAATAFELLERVGEQGHPASARV
ncbi:BTAD domain-containing putative transcriptional regulator [Aeromicrobium sp. CTD01-1L150]|uniref:AfsR/SARP family transcriptional regulator n=1 Tax=Aeromicrobium sp. CTD01-1L150 TaxID=3341830 RepID=UPI0035C1E471